MKKENENTLAVPNTVIEELRGAELIAWIFAEKFFIFSHKSYERNILPTSTTIEEWFKGFNFTQRGHKEILEAFNSLKEKGFIENNEVRCHTKDGKWTNFDDQDQMFFGTENCGYTIGIESFGGFTPVNNEITFSSKLSLKDKTVLTTLLYRWRYAKKFKSYDCSFREIENTFGLKKVNDVMEKLKKKNIVDYECNRGGWRELVSFKLNTSALDIKTRSTEVKKHYKKSGKPRKAYTRKPVGAKSAPTEEVKISEVLFMDIDYKSMLEEMEREDQATLDFYTEEEKKEPVEVEVKDIGVEENLYDLFSEAEAAQDVYLNVKERYIKCLNNNKEFIAKNDCSNKDNSFDNNEDPESIKRGYYTKGTAKAVVKVEDNEPKYLTEEDLYLNEKEEQRKEYFAMFDDLCWQDNNSAMKNFSEAYGF